MHRLMYSPRVLIACECTQVVCKAFREVGVEAYSCDLVPCRGGHPEWHIIADAARAVQTPVFLTTQVGALLVQRHPWDMVIAHPPCTMLTHCGAQHLVSGRHSMGDVERAADFFMKMLNADAKHVAVENPAPMGCAGLPRYTQIIQPYQFGHPYSKRVCLWLRNLPLLLPQRGYYVEHQQWVKHCSGKSLRRATTFEGIAEAMACQWGGLLFD